MSTLNINNFFVSNNLPFIIAGPCSVENKAQLTRIVQDLSLLPKIKMIRCGIWKPRTRPGGFEGLGNIALEWLCELKQQYNVHFAVEVAKPQHIELCLKNNIDTVWIGARTCGNPFSVNELSEALRGTELPVMIKNPLIPDIKLWIGAIERFQQVGIRQLIAIHRGFFLHNNHGFRNNPLWEIPMELKRNMPHLPLLCDPSHIAGKKELIANLSQTAMDLNFDGLMIEVHPEPEHAITDKEQQITPSELTEILDSLIVRSSGMPLPEELSYFRTKIDTLDHELLCILAQRFSIINQIAQIKVNNNLSVFQLDRWEQILNTRMETGKNMHIDTEFIKKIFEQIHCESIRIQDLIINKTEIKK